ncbi:MAG: class A beta-lactamase-related serine hydrolase, partial [Burkholderiales bacterium]
MLSGSGPAAAQSDTFSESATRAANLDAVFAEWNGERRPGCAVTVSRDGRIVATRAYGMAILESATPNTPATEFHVASVSKQFTAAAIRLLQAEG